MYHTIISADELNRQLAAPNWRIIDCHFELSDTALGRRTYEEGHIPGALYAHLDDDLSGDIIPGTTGRHPLPSVAAMAELFSQWGITDNTQVIVYDNKRGAIAARLWWMLRYLGHHKVAVLDGGLKAWMDAGFSLNQAHEQPAYANFRAQAQRNWITDVAIVDEWRSNPGCIVVDSRAAARYRGEVEPIDPVAGHVPGAISLPFSDNWQANGLLHSPEELRERFEALAPEQTTFYCGSGVTACHNLLAFAHAGLGAARLYPGSWSDWITDAERPVALREE